MTDAASFDSTPFDSAGPGEALPIDQAGSGSDADQLPPPPPPDWATLLARHDEARGRALRFAGQREKLRRDRDARAAEETELAGRVGRAADVEAALERLAENLFDGIMEELRVHLTNALRDVLGQPLKLLIDYKSTQAAGIGARLEFAIERGGETENLMRGQGGSVANVLSVGLRLFALRSLDPERHRPFALLDEQDCWLRPDLVPALARLAREAGERLGLQTLMISHHDVSLFENEAARIIRFELREGRIVCETETGGE